MFQDKIKVYCDFANNFFSEFVNIYVKRLYKYFDILETEHYKNILTRKEIRKKFIVLAVYNAHCDKYRLYMYMNFS